jgi:DNA-binding transcriptional ArsR family regulator
VSELAAPFAISQPAVSRHLRVLRDAGLVEEGREAQYRPRRLRPEALREVSDWLEQYRKLWDDRLDRLEEYLMDLQKSEKREKRSEKRDKRGTGSRGR